GEGMYFDTTKVSDYGKLAHLDVSGLEAGKRVDVSGKRHITDFAVWKFSPTDKKRDMEWDSPWGIGFPGWHLECSVIARETLGDRLDIHSGGIDHIPVHHTNEIAQTESITCEPFANLWLHNNHIKIDGTKISKSLGNVITLQDITDHGYSMDTFKVMVLSKHFETEGNFTWEILDAASNRLQNWRATAALRHQLHDTLRPDSENANIPSGAARQALLERLSDNLDTPGALALIDATVSAIESASPTTINPDNLEAFFMSVDELLGLRIITSTPDIDDDQKRLIIERNAAREAKDWATSDKLRAALSEQNIGLNDTKHGTVWYYQS
ncbi:MAG TPA: class I tRNA ligase family protein, partial [Candidatus Saccharimonadaceae bacterium]|nr:class I tRNA ligase family protein [Candidatus Saccharimonadaceae bacterium]